MTRFSDGRGRGSRTGIFIAGIMVVGTLLACVRDSVTLASGVADEPMFKPADAGDRAPDADASRALCIATECPAPLATCPARDGKLPAYACTTNLDDDPVHCGACDIECPEMSPAYHVRMGCAKGTCRAFCNDGYNDCNGIPDDGCEVSLMADSANCGACGVRCPSGVACKNGQCGCPPGTTECGDKCVDLGSNDDNCGRCGFACFEHQPTDAGAPPPHMYFGCSEGQCKDLRCDQSGLPFWEDCNHSIYPDGCEVDLRRDPAHCGACGNECAPGKQCFSQGGKVDCQCKPGETLCPPAGSEGASCADIENDPRNCGACGYVCPFAPNAQPVCSRGRCKLKCSAGTADCNGRDDDGCEVELSKDPRNCGACGAMCDLARGQPCVDGQCAMQDCVDPGAK